MNTKIISFNETTEAVKALKKGELACFPTETVYGIGCIAKSEKAFQRLIEAKRRSPNKPFTLMCASIGQAVQYAEVNVGVLAVMKEFLPGEVTLLLKARKGLKEWITFGSDVIGVRVPNHPQVQNMIDLVGAPLLVPSANRSGEPTSVSFQETLETFRGEASVIIDGECLGKTASTIVDLSGDEPRLVREGPVSFDRIKEVYENASMTVSIGCDHGAYKLKEDIRIHLLERGITVLDKGTYNPASVDYPLFGQAVAKDVVSEKANLGIVCCTSGEGIAIAANKVPGIRCGIGYDDVVTAKCREHNNANVISFGAKYMKKKDVLRRVDIFLAEKFSVEEKHHRRVVEIENF